jgi:hypothetical protein
MAIDSAPRLTIELVPQTCWFSNVRDRVSREDWDRIRKQVYKRSGQCCEVCGGRGRKHPIRSDLVARRVGSRGLRSRSEGHRRSQREIGRGSIVGGGRSHRRGPELRGAGHTAERDRLIHRSFDAGLGSRVRRASNEALLRRRPSCFVEHVSLPLGASKAERLVPARGRMVQAASFAAELAGDGRAGLSGVDELLGELHALLQVG